MMIDTALQNIIFLKYIQNDIKQAKRIAIDVNHRGYFRFRYDDFALDLYLQERDGAYRLDLTIEKTGSDIFHFSFDRYNGKWLESNTADRLFVDWHNFLIDKINEIK